MMSQLSEPPGGQPGRFLRRLETLENIVREVKQINCLLQMRVEAVEKWKEHAERWLFDNFEVKFDLSMPFQVNKVEVKDDMSEHLLDESTMETDESELGSQRSTAAFSTKNRSLSHSMIFSTPLKPEEAPLVNGANGTTSDSEKVSIDCTVNADDDIQILEVETSDVDHGISIRSVRSLFDSDLEIEEESINIGVSCSGAEKKSVAPNDSGIKTPTSLATSINSARLKLPLVELEEEEQLREPGAVSVTSMITPNVSVTLQKSGSVVGTPRKIQQQDMQTPKKDEAMTLSITTPKRVNGNINIGAMTNGTARDLPNPASVSVAKLTNGTMLPPEPKSVPSTSKSSSGKSAPISGKTSPYKGGAMIKPHRRKSTKSVYNPANAAARANTPNADLEDDTPCDVCQGVEPELGNEMIFCDSCNVCVHQACYGVRPIPQGKWLCNPCKQGLNPKEIQCRFCPAFGGALKPVQSPAKIHWAHVSCALWIPEVNLGSKTTMEPVINIQRIPKDRWSLRCNICNEKKGACIQCQFSRKCVRAFHVTCAMKNHLEMKGTVDDDLSDGCELKAFCKVHSFGKGGDEKKRKKRKRGVSKSPNKKPRLDEETASAVTHRLNDE